MDNKGFEAFSPPPPPYTDQTAYPMGHDSSNRAAAYAAPPPPQYPSDFNYAAPPPEQYGGVKYTAANPAIPTVPIIQMNPVLTLGRQPVQCTCSCCRALIVTHTEQSYSVWAWVICAVLILLGCWLGCCLIPFCIDDLQNTVHYCPNCRAMIGEYRPL